MKQIFTFIAVIAIICVFPLAASAAQTAPENTDSVTADTPQSEADSIDVAESTQGAATNGSDEEASEESSDAYNVFELIYDRICDYSGEIFCALTLLGTAVLSFAYKRGLLPLIKNSLAAIGGAVGQLKENTELGAGALGEQSEKIKDSLAFLNTALSCFEDKLTELEKRLSGIDKLEKSGAATEIILRCQVDALSEIFMSSSLPEYRKAALGEKLTKMREALGNASEQGKE